jgi:hypothetical protein
MTADNSFVVNPYIAGSPVKDAAMFFGREDVYAWLRQHLRGAYQDNVIILYGERRSGKTSILYQMKEGLGDDHYIPVLLDLQGMGLEGMDGFLWEVARKIVLALRSFDNIPALERPTRRDFEANPLHQFEDVFLPEINQALGNQRLLLMFDESNRLAEKVDEGQLPPDVFDHLRSLAQQVDKLNFLFTLGRRIEATDRGSSHLFNLAVYRKISFLDPDFSQDLITRPVANYFSYTDAAIERILRLTSGQPYYTQLLCHNLFTHWTQKRPAQLDEPDVEAVLPDVMEQGTPNLQFLWEDSSPVEQAVLAAMANAAPRYRGGVMRRNLDRALRRAELYPPPGDVTTGLKNLFERDLLSDREPYEFRLELAQIWLNKFKRLSWVKEELGETAKQWHQLELQRQAQAPTPFERAKRWAAPALALVVLALLVVAAQLFSDIQRVQEESSAALDAAEQLRIIEAARFEATVSTAGTSLARLQQAANPADIEERATAQAAEAVAAIALAQITATAAQAQISTLEAGAVQMDIIDAPTLTPTGTPPATETPPPTATPMPPATPTPRPAFAAPLAGTIAYPAFNGQSYDLYLGDVASGSSRLFRGQASQPAFNADGSRIAFQSWAGNSRGLITASSRGGNEFLITNFLEDELPSWSPDGSSILFFSRRTGDRRALLYVTKADTEFRDNPARQLDIEGEAPWWGANGQIVFKGWGSTGPGLRLTNSDFATAQTVTTAGNVYAPALSPNGQQVAYMARDDSGNWDIYRVNVNGTGEVRLTTNAARDGLPTWSPNGRAIAFVSNRGGQWAIYGLNADGSVEQKLLDMAGSPDGIVFFDQANSTGWLEERISWTP